MTVVVLKLYGRTLMDREALAQWTRRSIHTIRARCEPCGKDQIGRTLYHAEACADLLDTIPQRRRS